MRQSFDFRLPRRNQHRACDHEYWWFSAAVLTGHCHSSAARNLYVFIGSLRQLELQGDPCRLRGQQIYVEQSKEFDVGLLRDAVQPVDYRLADEGEHFD